MTEHRTDHETALRHALSRAVDDVIPAPDALATIRTRIERGEGRLSAPARLRAAAGDARWRVRARTRPGGRPAHPATTAHGPATGDYVPPGPSVSSTVRSRGRKAAMAVAGVFALLTTGLAVNQLTAADGATSPEAAVRDLFDAIDREDPLGVLESLTPSEREVLVPSVQRLAEQLKRFDVADDGLDLEHVDGLDLRVEGLELRTQGLHPDVAAVEVTGGTIATSANFRELPLGRVLSAALEEAGGRNLDEPVDDEIPLDLTLATRRTGDRWHVSLLYSVAENMRANDGAPLPDFGNGIPAKGADSPRGAVDAMVEAFNRQDFTRMIELTPLDSAAVLHDYGPVLLDDDQAGSSSTVFEDITFGGPQGSGGTRTLTVESYRMVQSYGGEPESTVVYDGSCVTSTSSDEFTTPSGPQTVCADDHSTGVSLGFGLAPGSVSLLLFGPGQAEIVVVERDGAWYVDPALSAVETLLRDVEGASPGQIDRTVEQWAAMASGDDGAWYATYSAPYFEGCPGVQAPGPDASFEERKDAGLRCDEERYGSDGEVEVTPTTVIGPEVACLDAGDEAVVEACLQGLGDPAAIARFHVSSCRSSGEPTAVERCLQELVDEGEIEPSAVVEYRCEVANQPVDGGDSFAAERAFEKCMEYAGTGDEPEEEQMGPAIPLPPPTTTG